MKFAIGMVVASVWLGLGAYASASASAATASPPTTTPFYATPFEHKPDVPTLTALGRALFADKSLSASGRVACSTCHDPAHSYAPGNALAVQLGGRDGRQPGLRSVPSLTYRQSVPAFSEHFSDSDGDDSVDQGPTGGRDWDGRASSAHEQAQGPLLSVFEMANTTPAEVVSRLRSSPNAASFRSAFGPHVLDDPSLAWNGLLWALEVFQQSPADFYPYSSKYDAVLRGQARLTERERHGLELFNDPEKGNCASCHPSAIKQGAFPAFTDHGFIAIGVPRNPRIPANANPRFHDLGLCGPLRTDLSDNTTYCGLFRTPSLRNVATRQTFFHNGVFTRLDDAVRFYAQRDTRPQRYYRTDRGGRPVPFDDMPARFKDNVNMDPPFGKVLGSRPALSEPEIADVVAFLKTLSDGFRIDVDRHGVRH